MASRANRNEDDTEGVIRRELHSKENARFLRSMPAFRLDETLPGRLASLMDELRHAERGGWAGGNQSGALGAASGPQRK
ncbi:MAG: hypothetical protein KGZ68_18410 [Dechloromonas sp.]|nr:hypothetical protein [Dechloromonas sp.]